MEQPCRWCKDRHINCHSECDKYKEWRKELDRINYKRKRAERKERYQW